MKDKITLGQAFKLLGLKEVTYDPWGNGQAYLQWLHRLNPSNILHDRLGFWVHIRTCGTLYFPWIYWMAGQCIDFSSMPGNLIFSLMCTGGIIEDYIFARLMTDEDRKCYWRLDYTKPLPYAYVGDLWLRQRPLQEFISDTKVIIFGRLANEEFQKRKKRYPELDTLERCMVAEFSYLQQYSKLKFPNERIPDRKEELKKLSDWARAHVGNIKGLSSEETRYQAASGVYDILIKPVGKKFEGLTEEQQKEYLRKIDEGDYHLYRKQEKIIASALDGNLAGYLHTSIKNDYLDENRYFKGARGISETDIPLIEEAAVSPGPQEDLALEELVLTLDELTPKELWVVKDVFQAFDEGYKFNSKQGRSFPTRWGEDYGANIKAWRRAQAKLNRK